MGINLQLKGNIDLRIVLLMAEILHQLIWRISHSLQGSIHPRWCRISSTNSSIVIWFVWVYIGVNYFGENHRKTLSLSTATTVANIGFNITGCQGRHFFFKQL